MILAKYKNGNVTVTIYYDGTKIREFDNEPLVAFPECLDVKITNYCDNNCHYCYEDSDINGKHANVDRLLNVLDPLPRGIEIALGGGNPLAHPDLGFLLGALSNKGFITNITINSNHLPKYLNKIIEYKANKLIYGIGVSVPPEYITSRNEIIELLRRTDDVVFHVICGLSNLPIIDDLMKLYGEAICGISGVYPNSWAAKVLVLGYKNMGRAIESFFKNFSNVGDWYRNIGHYFGKCYLSFDNLAIEQLNIKRFFTNHTWKKFYMGNEFSHTMFIDAVNEEFAESSTSMDRFKIDGSLIEFFNRKGDRYYK